MGAAHADVARGPRHIAPWCVLLALLGFGCADSHSRGADAGVDKPSADFEGDAPPGVGEGTRPGDALWSDGSGDGDSSASSDGAGAIVEAELIQAETNRLYTLSRAAGLSVIDITFSDHLRILDRYRALQGTPVALQVRDRVAIALFSGWGRYAANDNGNYEWVQGSKIVALDADDPTEIVFLGSLDVPGTLADVRFVDDRLYVVSEQDSRTALRSFDLSDPRHMRMVDELAFDGTHSPTDADGLSIAFTEQRVYVAGVAQDASEPRRAVIQAIDISDPTGRMVKGDTVEVAGWISGPEQMDEHEGVLRVVSNLAAGDLAHPTVVETFRVVSSAELQPLGSTALAFPRQEQAHHVRFDGPRAYAFPLSVTQTDRLFIVDLSDPARPAQAATLAIGGRNLLSYIQPRGDRLLGLGYDWSNGPNSFRLWLFDVSDLARPSLIDEVRFGDALTDGFDLFDEAGLILVPFWEDRQGQSDCGRAQRGMQLIDLVDDTLTVRGKVRANDVIRRAFVLGDRLLTVSNEWVESLDIADRDAPRAPSRVVLARREAQAFEFLGGAVARLYTDAWSGAPSIDFVANSEAGEPNASFGGLDLRALGVAPQCQDTGPSSFEVSGAFARSRIRVEVVYSFEEQFDNHRYGLAIVDGDDPASPVLLSNTTWAYEPGWSWYDGDSGYDYGYYGDQKALVRTDSAIVILERHWMGGSATQQRLRVVDVRDPSAPSTSLLDLPGPRQYAGLIAVGDTVMTSHVELSDGTGRARFYLDRFDLSDPQRLVQANPVNIPGALMHVDEDSGDLLISELVRKESQAETTEACFERYAFPDRRPEDVLSWGGPPGPCVGYTQRLHLVSIDSGVATIEDTLTFEDDEHVRAVAAGDGVVFVALGYGGYYYGDDRSIWAGIDCLEHPCGYGDGVARPAELLTLSGFGKGRLEAGRLTTDGQEGWLGFWGTPGVHAAGDRALLVGRDELAIVDAEDRAHPILVRTEPLYGAPHSVHVSKEGKALLSSGLEGLQRVDLQ